MIKRYEYDFEIKKNKRKNIENVLELWLKEVVKEQQIDINSFELNSLIENLKNYINYNKFYIDPNFEYYFSKKHTNYGIVSTKEVLGSYENVPRLLNIFEKKVKELKKNL